MPRNRTPIDRARTSGAAEHDRKRFEGRRGPKHVRPLGDPYATMTNPQKAAWNELRNECPWLHSAHRPLVRLAATLMARMDTGELGVSGMQALSGILSKLAATPVDETKANHAADDDDPSDKFFGATH